MLLGARRARRSRQGIAVLLCAAAVGLVACGGDDDSSNEPSAEQADAARQITSIGQQLKVAYDTKDAAGACALLDPAGLKEEFGSRKVCVKRVTSAINQGKGSPDIDFGEVTVDGDTASAVSKADGGGETVYDFVRVGDKWFIDISSDQPDSSGVQAGSPPAGE